MSVENTDNIIEEAGNGIKVAFDFAFKITASTDLIVRKKSAAGVYTAPLVLNTDYTVSFDSEDETGTVTYIVAPVGSGGGSFIARLTALTQGSTLPRESQFPERTMEAMVDKLALIVQDHAEILSRAPLQPQFPSGPSAIGIEAPVHSKGLKYSISGGVTTIVNTEIDPDSMAVSAAEAAASAAAADASAADAAASAADAAASAGAAGVVQTGTFAARPASFVAGTHYYATDIEQLYFYAPPAAKWYLIG